MQSSRRQAPERKVLDASRIYRGIQQIIVRYHPDGVCLEKVFCAQPAERPQTRTERGVALLAAAENQLDIYEYSSNEIKSAVVGYGRDQGASAGNGRVASPCFGR